MITLGKEQPMVLTIDKNIFDPQMEQMYLNAQQNYINALQKDYDNIQDQLKEFKKTYGDFYSPSDKDNENWNNLTYGPIKQLMKQYGPDLLRSVEGRSLIQKALSSVDYGTLSKLKASVEPAKQWLKNQADLEAKGLYSQDFQDWYNKKHGLKNPKDWDTLKDGVFNQTSPQKFETVNALTHTWFDDAQPLYKGMENGQRVYSLDFDDLKNIAKSNAEDFIHTSQGGYMYEKIIDKLKTNNPHMSEDEIKDKAIDELDTVVTNANLERLRPKKYEADPFELERFRTNEGIREHAANAATDFAYWRAQQGEKDSNNYQNIFRDAKNDQFGTIHYNPEQTNDLKINSSPGKGVSESYKNGKFQAYTIPAKEVNNLLYSTKSVYTKSKPVNVRIVKNSGTPQYVFTPTGEFHAKTNEKGHTRYFISGQLSYKYKDQDGKDRWSVLGSTSGTRQTFQMEVFEKPHSYKNKYQEP